VAVGLALANYVQRQSPARTVRFVFFTNEEPPFFRTASMGSEVNARAARERKDDVKAMIALETMGYFTDEANTQHYPWPFSAFYPSTGNFIAFVGDTSSGDLARACVEAFRKSAKVPSEGASIPAFIEGADWSDHGPFWRQDYRALMVTDTAPFRNPNYHEATDLPDRVDFKRLALTTEGLFAVLDALAR
jgi:Zn-dependent M28 family amino/carboxypeptidase